VDHSNCPEATLHLHRSRVLIATFSSLAALRTSTDVFPNINIPVIGVVWDCTGLPPSDMSGRKPVRFFSKPLKLGLAKMEWTKHTSFEARSGLDVIWCAKVGR
jgi:hypothetical protein